MKQAIKKCGNYGFLIAVSLLSGGLVVAAPIDIPVNTWVARPVPAVGEGPSDGMKHVRIAYNSSNKRHYFGGGDYVGPNFFASGRNEIYSYSIQDGDWRKERPYCPEDGDYQPAGPDQTGWVYDSRRNLFWMTPGYTSLGSANNCNPGEGEAGWKGTLTNKLMAFNPETQQWIYDSNNPRSLPPGPPSNRKFAHYDPVTDTIIRLAWTGSASVEIYDITNDQWTVKSLPSVVGNARVGFDYSALDVVGRAIYLVSPYEGRLIRYDISLQTADYISDLPTGPIEKENSYLVWDSVNQVMLLLVNANTLTGFYAYHPNTNTWETLPITHPDGYMVRGRAIVYDPDQNILLINGGTSPANPYLFLYRYGNDNTNIPIPSAPTGLNIALP